MARGQSKQSNKQTHQYKFGWWEVKMGVLLVFIVLMLTIGMRLQKHERQSLIISSWTLAPRIWKWDMPLEQRLGVTFKQPWQMTEADLTGGRVVYNMLTKPGFRILAGQLVLGFVVLGMMTQGVNWMVGWQWRQVQRLSQAVSTMAHSTVTIEISGTVTIVAENGLIYARVTDEDEFSGQDQYGFYLANVKITLTHG
jgi:hypothetical protein